MLLNLLTKVKKDKYNSNINIILCFNMSVYDNVMYCLKEITILFNNTSFEVTYKKINSNQFRLQGTVQKYLKDDENSLKILRQLYNLYNLAEYYNDKYMYILYISIDDFVISFDSKTENKTIFDTHFDKMMQYIYIKKIFEPHVDILTDIEKELFKCLT